jgi:hypothetical protein
MVPSESQPGLLYRVCFGPVPTCTCHDYLRHRPQWCKHIWAVYYTILIENGDPVPDIDEDEDDNPPAERAPRRNWQGYRKAQANEYTKFRSLLRDLCSGLVTPAPTSKGGRPRVDLADVVFAAVFRVYARPAGAQFMGGQYKEALKDCVSDQFCPNTLFNYMADDRLTAILTRLITETAAPMQGLERGEFAVDGTGIGLRKYRRWVWEKELPDSVRLKRDWVKLNLMCGTRTKIVSAVEVMEGTANEGSGLRRLLAATAKQFRVVRVAADGQYSTVDNVNAIDAAGAQPVIPYEDYATGYVGEPGGPWRRWLHYFRYRHAEFSRYFARRNIVESVFSMIKERFGEFVRSRTKAAITNEVLCKIVCHNIVRVIYVMYDAGLEPEFTSKPAAALRR